jgi:hypothetical protein
VLADYDFPELDAWRSWEQTFAALANDATTEFPAT